MTQDEENTKIIPPIELRHRFIAIAVADAHDLIENREYQAAKEILLKYAD